MPAPTAIKIKPSVRGRPDGARVARARRRAAGGRDGVGPAQAHAAVGRGSERNCSIARTVTILSDAWTFLVIREAFFGARRFETFRSSLGLPRGTLADRLKALTAQGIFCRVRYGEAANRVEYRLTPPGLDLYPVFIALMQYGDRWLAEDGDAPLQLQHRACGHVAKPIVACSHCLERVEAGTTVWIDGPGAGQELHPGGRRPRRSADPSLYMRGRPSSVSRSLGIVGDRWSCLVIREVMLGVTRFDKLQAALNIAPNILTDRLGRLVRIGVLEKHAYQQGPERFDYRLTEMGLDLFGSLAAMMAWGDKHRSDGKPPRLMRHAICGKVFTPVVICDKCQAPIDAHSMRYRLRYRPADYAVDGEGRRKEPGRI